MEFVVRNIEKLGFLKKWEIKKVPQTSSDQPIYVIESWCPSSKRHYAFVRQKNLTRDINIQASTWKGTNDERKKKKTFDINRSGFNKEKLLMRKEDGGHK